MLFVDIFCFGVSVCVIVVGLYVMEVIERIGEYGSKCYNRFCRS